VLYKVIAKVLNERLKKVADICLTRSQKGFTDNRYIQECLINIIENIQHCKKNGIPGIVLALDQEKAFDSVDHDFMTETYKFFGMGPNFIKMLNVLTTGRNASLMWDDGTQSDCFDLEGGNAQGNAPSPKQFNFGQQILLFKIEFSPALINIFMPRILRPVEIMEPQDGLPASPMEQGGLVVAQLDPQQDPLLQPDPQPDPQLPPAPEQGNDDKVETFADDATATGRAEERSLTDVKVI
jgi:Reverse transcriptase (RNA-dependent DNA polymerase)